MPRAVLAAIVIGAAWLRLESPHDRALVVAAIVALALAPLVRREAVVLSLLLFPRLAFGEWPWHLIRVTSRFGTGFLDFYDVKTPFDPRVQAEMRGVVLTAIFGFTLLLATRWPPAQVAAVLVGAGWPATLAGTTNAIATGVAMLVAVLVLLSRHARVAVPAAVALAVAAVAASASSAVAKGGLVGWQHWDLYTPPVKPVSVAYVWNANYEGVRFPRKRTLVLQIDAPPQSLFWRAAVLDSFAEDRWVETAPLRGDALEPAASGGLVTQHVHVLALSDTHLVGASVPISFRAGGAVTKSPGFATLPGGLTRGYAYTVQSYAAHPTAAQLERSPARYPSQLDDFLEVWPGVDAPAFGKPRAAFLDAFPDIERYAPLLNDALAVAGHARTPYAAATALVRWFRQTGGFRYTERPALFPAAPLVGFVAETRAGYCQHFAGAMALMLRYLGVPARVAVGFSSGTYDAARHRWDVSDHDAHAWVEAWFRGYGWLPFDPTPQAGRPERGTLTAPYARAAFARPAAAAPRTGRADRSSGHRHGETSTSTATTGTVAAPARSRGVSLVLLLATLLAGVVALIVAAKLAARATRRLTRDPRRVAAACRQELADFLLDQRIEGARSATLHELGELVRSELSVDPDAFVAAATAARFGRPEGADAASRQARRELRRLRTQMRKRLRGRERLRGALSLRSLGFAG